MGGMGAKKKKKGQDPDAPLPSSLFVLTENTKLRQITRFIIEWVSKKKDGHVF